MATFSNNAASPHSVNGNHGGTTLFPFLRLFTPPGTPVLAPRVPTVPPAFAVPASIRQRFALIVDFAGFTYIANQDFSFNDHSINLAYKPFFSQLTGTLYPINGYNVPKGGSDVRWNLSAQF